MQPIHRMYNKYKKGSKDSISEKAFREVLSLIYKGIKDIIIKSGYFKLPNGLGTIQVIRHEYIPRIREGKLIGLPPISFSKTMKLWEEDEESKNNKILIRHIDTVFYIVKYSSKKTAFPNRNNYKFEFRRFLKNSVNAYNNGKEAYHTKSSDR